MKKFLILFLFLHGSSVFSQDWSPFRLDSVSVYQVGPLYPFNSTPTIYQMFRPDTVYVNGTDTVIRNYHTFDYAEMYCAITHDTNALADKTVLRSNGDALFFNGNNDTITIKRYAQLNDNWHLFNFSNGDYLEATIIQLSLQNVITTPDSVKIISLQRKDAGGNPVNDIFNGLEIWLTKNYGLALFYNTLAFPNDVTEYLLVGKASEGVPSLTHDVIYDFDTGDRFQWTGHASAMASYSDFEYREWDILSEYISLNLDTTIYTIEQQSLRKYYWWSPALDSTITYNHDTITFTVIKSAHDLLDSLTYSPLFTFATGGGYSFQFIDTLYNSRIKKEIDPYYFGNPSDSCIMFPVGECVFERRTYARGLGLIMIRNSGATECYHEDMNWFHKQSPSETWGTPFSWSVLLGMAENGSENGFHLWPNPAENALNIGLSTPSTEGSSYQILDVAGRILKEGNIAASATVIQVPVNELPAGTYICKVVSNGKTGYSRFVCR